MQHAYDVNVIQHEHRSNHLTSPISEARPQLPSLLLPSSSILLQVPSIVLVAISILTRHQLPFTVLLIQMLMGLLYPLFLLELSYVHSRQQSQFVFSLLLPIFSLLILSNDVFDGLHLSFSWLSQLLHFQSSLVNWQILIVL